jgi:hypothetical protein
VFAADDDRQSNVPEAVFALVFQVTFPAVVEVGIYEGITFMAACPGGGGGTVKPAADILPAYGDDDIAFGVEYRRDYSRHPEMGFEQPLNFFDIKHLEQIRVVHGASCIPSRPSVLVGGGKLSLAELSVRSLFVWLDPAVIFVEQPYCRSEKRVGHDVRIFG